jgi:putative ABC transport system permease protein
VGTASQDIRFALRNLRKSPAFAIIPAVTLALGIGASTSILSVIENVLMEPFPYTDPARLVSVQIHDTERNKQGGRPAFSGPEFLDYVAQNHVFDRVMANAGLDVLYR